MGNNVIAFIKNITTKTEIIQSEDYPQEMFVGAGIMAFLLLVSIVLLLKVGLKKYNGNRKEMAKYEKTQAKVLGNSLETTQRISQYGVKNITYDEMEIEYHDTDGRIFRKFTRRINDVESIDIYYKKSDHELFVPAYELEEDDEYEGEYVYGVSLRIFFGVLTGFFAVGMLYFLVSAL